VRIRFPACAPADRPSRVEPPPPPEKAKAGLKILLVDDDELIQGAMQAMLGALGHQVASAWTGEEALGMLDFHPDVVILDMNMPGLGGAATLARLRGLCPSLPVLLSTGKVDQAALDLVEAHPHVTLLSKPFSMGELKHHLEQRG
jgi:CheY-like chemotaxis protein